MVYTWIGPRAVSFSPAGPSPAMLTPEPLASSSLTPTSSSTPPPVSPSTSAYLSAYSSGDVGYILLCSALALIMVPGLAFLYSGLARRKSALSMIWAVMASSSVVLLQWYLWGYSLALGGGPNTSAFIGNLRNFGLMGVLVGPSPGGAGVPELLYALYQGMFLCVTAAIIAGAIAERGRVIPMLLFLFLWATLVYSPVAHWVWSPTGWAFRWGVLDYAGGGPVELCSGTSALAYSLILGRRHDHMMLNFRPHNVSLITLGTVILWFGWLGFNGGSAMGANLRAVVACWNSNLCAAIAGITWVLLDWRLAKKWSMVGWCSGTISGLVAATPVAGYVHPWAAVVIGFVTGVVCNYATKVKFWIRIDDSLDVFAEHGVAGIVGLLSNALFASASVSSLDGVSSSAVPLSFLDHHWAQLYKQLVFVLAVGAYSFSVSVIIAWGIDKLPGMQLRASEEAELLGIDDDQLGEFAYDYVEVRRDFLAWTPAKGRFEDGVVAVPRRERHGIVEHRKLFGGESTGTEETEEGSEKTERGTGMTSEVSVDGMKDAMKEDKLENKEKEFGTVKTETQ